MDFIRIEDIPDGVEVIQDGDGVILDGDRGMVIPGGHGMVVTHGGKKNLTGQSRKVELKSVSIHAEAVDNLCISG